jgi:hypothetical protein
MSVKRNMLLVLWPVAITLIALAAASITDIVLSALLPRFSSRGLTITCFAVAGVFAGLFCYNAALQSVVAEEKEKFALRAVIVMATLCSLLFFAVAPLSGHEYNIPFRTFAAAEVIMVAFLWKNKFHLDT